jgi:hypothetical protein
MVVFGYFAKKFSCFGITCNGSQRDFDDSVFAVGTRFQVVGAAFAVVGVDVFGIFEM